MSAPEVSIVYVTHRPNPRFEWFADSLANQLGDGSEAEVIVVDGAFSPERERELRGSPGAASSCATSRRSRPLTAAGTA